MNFSLPVAVGCEPANERYSVASLLRFPVGADCEPSIVLYLPLFSRPVAVGCDPDIARVWTTFAPSVALAAGCEPVRDLMAWYSLVSVPVWAG